MNFLNLRSACAKLDIGKEWMPRLEICEDQAGFVSCLENIIFGSGSVSASARPRGARICVISDGVPKICCVGQQMIDFDDFLVSTISKIVEPVQQSLSLDFKSENLPQNLSFTMNHLVLSQSNGFPSSDALASLAVARQVKDYLRIQKIDVVVAAGSGSVTDIAKHALFLYEKEQSEEDIKIGAIADGSQYAQILLVSVPTALTVTAFTSAFAVLESAGHKSTFASRLPDATLFFSGVTKNAPLDLRAAGVGDLLAGFVSYADWYLSQRLGLSTDFSLKAARLMTELQQVLLEPGALDPLGQGYSDARVHQLSELLAAAGVAMNLGLSSAPQSGGEHAVSHVFDYLRTVSGRRKWLHGLQVALTTLSSCAIYDWLKSLEFIPTAWVCSFKPQEIDAIVRKLFWEAPFSGDASDFRDENARQQFIESKSKELSAELEACLGVARHKAEQWELVRERFSDFQIHFEETIKELQLMTISAERFHTVLLAWGLPDVCEKMNPPGQAVEQRFALRFSPFFRQRFGVQDLVFWLGEDPVAAAAL